MKIRHDFVTNSSSSCFIVKINKYLADEDKWSLQNVKETLQIMLDSYNKIHRKDEPLSFDDVFGYVGVPNDDNALMQAFDDAYWDGNAKYDLYDKYLGENLKSNKTYIDIVKFGDFVIFSNGDNSIPYELHRYIEDTFDAKRLHLG